VAELSSVGTPTAEWIVALEYSRWIPSTVTGWFDLATRLTEYAVRAGRSQPHLAAVALFRALLDGRFDTLTTHDTDRIDQAAQAHLAMVSEIRQAAVKHAGTHRPGFLERTLNMRGKRDSPSAQVRDHGIEQ